MFNTNWAIFQLYHGENKLHFDEMMMMSTFYKTWHSWQGVLNTTLRDEVCQWLAAGLWFSPGTPASSTHKTDSYDIIERHAELDFHSAISLKQQSTGKHVAPLWNIILTLETTMLREVTNCNIWYDQGSNPQFTKQSRESCIVKSLQDHNFINLIPFFHKLKWKLYRCSF